MNEPANTTNGVASDEFGGKPETPDERTVNYIFPVTIVVVGALTDDDHDAIDRRVWTAFSDAIRDV